MELVSRTELIKEIYPEIPYATMDERGVWIIGLGSIIYDNGLMLIGPDARKRACELYPKAIDDSEMEPIVVGIIEKIDLLLKDTELGHWQKAALTLLIYSIGIPRFKVSPILKILSKKQYTAIPQQFNRWAFINGYLHPALVAKRVKEIEIWNHDPSNQ